MYVCARVRAPCTFVRVRVCVCVFVIYSKVSLIYIYIFAVGAYKYLGIYTYILINSKNSCKNKERYHLFFLCVHSFYVIIFLVIMLVQRIEKLMFIMRYINIVLLLLFIISFYIFK